MSAKCQKRTFCPLTFIEKASRLYEQERGTPSDASPLGMYVTRWLAWAAAGLVSKDQTDNPQLRPPVPEDAVRLGAIPPPSVHQPNMCLAGAARHVCGV